MPLLVPYDYYIYTYRGRHRRAIGLYSPAFYDATLAADGSVSRKSSAESRAISPPPNTPRAGFAIFVILKFPLIFHLYTFRGGAAFCAMRRHARQFLVNTRAASPPHFRQLSLGVSFFHALIIMARLSENGISQEAGIIYRR